MSQTVTLQPVSNREDWDDTFELFDAETGAALDLSAVTAITLTVWDEESRSIRISKSLGAGVSILDLAGGVVAIHAAASEMESLHAKSYPLRLSMVNGGATKDLILGVLPVEDGGPT